MQSVKQQQSPKLNDKVRFLNRLESIDENEIIDNSSHDVDIDEKSLANQEVKDNNEYQIDHDIKQWKHKKKTKKKRRVPFVVNYWT